MASLKYLISQMVDERENAERAAWQEYLRDKHGCAPKRPATHNTIRQHKDHAIKYGAWCKRTYHSKKVEDCAQYIQDYVTFLAAKGLSASTIHTYLAGVCYAFNVDLADIQKPPRRTARNQRSRGVKTSDVRSDTQRDISPRLYDFAAVVGCRHAEYAALRQNDLVMDVNGHLCVLVRRGKGGKKQYQRILPDDIELVKSYFDGSDCFVFDKSELQNKLDLHALRAKQARKAYTYYLERIQKEPGYREILLTEIKNTWDADDAERAEKGWKKKRWRQSQVEGEYRLRGETRKLAEQHGLPISYDRLAAMAVSIYHLAHWRLDVTIDNYLIAV